MCAEDQVKPQIDAGFRLLYELKFEEARAQFRMWQKAHPEDPLGLTAEAASFLFQEFNRQEVLTSKFFLDDAKFLGGVSVKPDPQLTRGFQSAAGKAQSLAEVLRKTNPKNPDSLFALTLVFGMLGNYKAMIEHKHLEGLRLTKRAEKLAGELLAIQPGAKDAYLAIGASNYIVGSLPSPKRFFLWFGGITGNREAGMKQLQQAANGGHYLRPYAKILLALAALREKKPELARALLEELQAEFAGNPLFAKELALLKQKGAAAARK